MTPDLEKDFKQESKALPKKTISEARDSKPMKILTEKDAYLSEVIDSQPSNLADIDVTPKERDLNIHRLALPEFFEQYSYDCTRGITCEHHGWTQIDVHYSIEHAMKQWKQTKFGKYVFRWFLNKKRSIDEAKNLHGWYLVNQTLFSDAPRILFSINGSLEEGDNILGFMPVEKALRKRNRPSEISVGKMNSEKEKFEDNPNFYKAKLSPEKVEGDDYAPPDALQEGRDF